MMSRIGRCILLCTLLSLLHSSFAFGARTAARSQKHAMAAAVSSRLFRSKPRGASSLIVAASTDASAMEEEQSSTISWRDRLLKLSNIASVLCVIDCTVLPIVTVVLPLLGMVAFSPAQMEWLHELGHQVAMYFVLPVGGTAAAMNYSAHKKKWLSLPAAVGLLLIYMANGHGGPLLSRLPHDVAHALHCGTWIHRSTNVLGCAMLLSSNYYSHKATHLHGDGCSHHHH